MRIFLGLAVALIAGPALAQSTAAPQVGERPPAQAAATPRTAEGPLVVAESGCLKRLQTQLPQFRNALQAADRRDLRQLRDTAIIFARRGNEQGCTAVAAEMERIAAAAPAAANTATDRRSRASSARALDGRTTSMQDMLDADVVALGGEEVGEIEDVVVIHGPQPRAYAIVDRDGGWFDIRRDRVAVPLGQLRSIEGDEFAIAITEKAFGDLPALDRDRLDRAGAFDGVDRNWSALAR
ncbi:MAG TPA: PRC-barrel domain-containing protein [Azospirillum sp.]|nr:PRC-barrel domain-containing protein [Azospirillum sp.]